MTQKQIIDEVITHLDLHLKDVLGYIGQEPYKGDFFKLFKEAYREGYFQPSSNPRLTGDAFRIILLDRWNTGGDNKKQERQKLMEQLFARWDEWRYAWDHYVLIPK